MKQMTNDFHLDFYQGPTLSVTVNGEGARVHRLIDDTLHPVRAHKTVARRDPMVEALFGAAAALVKRRTPR
jgi:hypothetical protein